jgi:uncharacterized protein (DUF488 family)
VNAQVAAHDAPGAFEGGASAGTIGYDAAMTVFTIGHSTRSLDEFVAALSAFGVECVVDVRRFPHSRRRPQFEGAALAVALPQAGIAYRHLPDLGGRRAARSDRASPHTLWRESAFRNYADYAETAEFRAAFAALTELARTCRVAIMCAEAVWWRCHRRIIADHLLAVRVEVTHIFDAKKSEPARLTEGAALRHDGSVLYAGAQAQLPL